MKNSYDHHDHQDIYTYNLSVPKRFTLDVPNQSPPTWIVSGVYSMVYHLSNEINIIMTIVA